MPRTDALISTSKITDLDGTGGNYGHMIMPTTGKYVMNEPGQNIAPVPSTTWDDGNPYNSENAPSLEEVYEDFNLGEVPEVSHHTENSSNQVDIAGLTKDEHYDEEDPIDNEGGFSLAQYMQENPGLGYEDYMKVAAAYSDEFAEKYLDYLTEKGELDKANAYTAEREDTAYQRLVKDLKAAGLNPAMMYGSSASTSASGSQGYVKMTEGANSRGVTNYSKLKNLILAYMSYELKKSLGITNSVLNGVGKLTGLLGLFL